MTTASTQLRALEGEIEETDTPGFAGKYKAARILRERNALLTIAKELEKERDELQREVSEDNETIRLQHVLMKNAEARVSAKTSEEIASLRTENATLKRRLDEAMKELRFQAVSLRAAGYEESPRDLEKRITEIDKL